MNRVAEALDAGYAARLHAAAVHEEGIRLDAAVGCEETAAAGVEGGIVFKDGDGCFNGVEGRAAAGKDGVASLKRAAGTGFVGGGLAGRDSPGAAVDQKYGGVDGGGGHRNIVVHLVRGIPPKITPTAKIFRWGH